jgi:hypothetical protein
MGEGGRGTSWRLDGILGSSREPWGARGSSTPTVHQGVSVHGEEDTDETAHLLDFVIAQLGKDGQ